LPPYFDSKSGTITLSNPEFSVLVVVASRTSSPAKQLIAEAIDRQKQTNKRTDKGPFEGAALAR
jgi:hypothetical protein